MIRSLAIALFLPSSSFACAVAEAFDPADLALAPVVIVATVTGYVQDANTGIGTINVQVTEVMKGEAPAKLDLGWLPMMSEWPPQTWDREVNVIMAAVPPTGDLGWQLALETCGSAWLLPDTPTNREIVAFALVGG